MLKKCQLLLHDRGFTFFVRFGGRSRAIDNAGATTDRGLPLCDCVPAMETVSTVFAEVALKLPPHRVCP